MSGPAREADVVVLGGGPAGVAAALELARAGLEVQLLERSWYEQERIGDTLAPELCPWLSRWDCVGALAAEPAVESSGTVTLWGGEQPVETDFLCTPYGPARHVDRRRWDAAFARWAGERGVGVAHGFQPRTCVREGDVWRMSGTQRPTAGSPESSVTVAARWIVDATGRGTWFLRRHGVRRVAVDRLVALLVRCEDEQNGDPRLAVEARPEGWWYHAPLPGGRAVVAFLTDADLLPHRRDFAEFWRRRLSETTVIRARSGPAVRTASPRICAAHVAYATDAAGPGWLAVGDAVLSRDPLSGSGVLSALVSGCAAATAIIAAERGMADHWQAYQAAHAAAVHAELRERAEVYSRVTRWSSNPFWLRRIKNSPTVAEIGGDATA